MDPTLIAELRPYPNLSPSASATAVWIPRVGFGCLILIAIVFALRHLRKASRERRVTATAHLTPGETCLQGNIEPADDHQVPLRVEITQRRVGGEEAHAWQEVSRTAQTHPFYLRLSTGDRVRVEPGKSAYLVHDPNPEPISLTPSTRMRVVELRAGESVVVRGNLQHTVDPQAEAAYRHSPSGWQLRPGNAPLLVTSKPLGRPSVIRSRRHMIAAMAFALIACAFEYGMADYHRLRKGTTVDAEIAELHAVSSTNKKNKVVTDWNVDFRVANNHPLAGLACRDEVSQEVFAKLHKGDLVPARIAPSSPPLCSIGPLPTLNPGWLAVSLVALFASLVCYIAFSDRHTGWYDSPLNEPD